MKMFSLKINLPESAVSPLNLKKLIVELAECDAARLFDVMHPISYYERVRDYAHAYYEQLAEGVRTAPFYRMDTYDMMLKACKAAEYARKCIRELSRRERKSLETSEKKLQAFERGQLNAQWSLAPIESYGQLSKFSCLAVDEVAEEAAEQLERCETCSCVVCVCYLRPKWMNNFTPKPRVVVEEDWMPRASDVVFWGEDATCKTFAQIEEDLRRQYPDLWERNPHLMARLRKLLALYKVMRSTREVQFIKSVACERVYYALQYEKNVYRLLQLVEDEIFEKHPKMMANKEEDIRLPFLEDSPDIPLSEIKYSEIIYDKMKEDPTKVVFDPEAIVLAKPTLVNVAFNEMEEAHGNCDEVKKEKKSNVVLTAHADESVARPLTITRDNWEKLCSPQSVQQYTQLMERWQRFDEFEWNKNYDAADSPIVSYNLPVDFIRKKENIDSPNCIMFKLYAFTRFDMEIKIVVNSNKFHCGQLQASFYYGSTMDEHYSDREHPVLASQTTHCLIDAGAANDGLLSIPYRHYKPLMATSVRSDDTVALDMGKLRIFALNQLRTPVDDSSSVTVTLFFRFVNPRFHGMKPKSMGNIVNEMFAANSMANLVKETAGIVNQLFPDSERDNPTDVVPPKPMVPWSAHSWCIGDMSPEPLNVLRMQATGNTPHPPGTIPEENEMSIQYLTQIYGLVSQIKWEIDQKVGTILSKIPFSPIWDVAQYPSKSASNPTLTTCYMLPPVSIIANMFAYWRGSMEYRLDVVSTQFHTGRLIIAYLPREVLTRDPTIQELTFCDHVIFDLREAKQFVYVNSFLSDKPWWPRRNKSATASEQFPPGYIYIGVLNRLTAPKSISPTIEMNLYMRAGKDMEFHIPVCPSIGLSFNTEVKKSTNAFATIVEGYGPPSVGLYVGYWHTTGTGCVFRYDNVSDHVTQFTTPTSYNSVFKLFSPDVKISHPSYKDMPYLVVFPSSDGSYKYGAPFTTYALASAFAKTIRLDTAAKTWVYDINKLQPSNSQQGEYLPNNARYWWSITAEVEEQAGEERLKDCGPKIEVQKQVNSTWNGLLTFGEQITSVKQLIRRYVPYAQISSSATTKSVDPSRADFVVPIMPQGLGLQPSKLDYMNQIRDGPISILASGYRFFRGSMRLRLIFGCSENGCVWLQHRPDEALISTQVYRAPKSLRESLFHPGYAYLIQQTQMNEIVEVELPFYLAGQFGLLQRPDLSKKEDAVHYSLGNLYLGFDVMKGTPRDQPFICQIFSSMGDDMLFTVFQGFPSVFDLSNFDKPRLEDDFEVVENSEPSTSKGFFGKFKASVKQSIASEVKEAVKEEISATCDGVVQNLDLGDINGMNVDENKLTTLIKSLTSELDSSKQQMLLGIVSQLVHSIINPSITQIVWSVASIFMHIGLLCYSYLEKFIHACTRFIKSFNKLSAKKSEGASDVVQNADADEDQLNEAAFVSTCVTGMLALVGAKDKPLPKTIPNFAKYMYEGLPKFSLTANGLYTYLKNNLTMFKKIWQWLVQKFKPDYIYYTELAGAPDDVIQFVRGVQWSVDDRNELAVRKDPKALLKVYELANIAEMFLAKKAVSVGSKQFPLFNNYCNRIIKLRNELTKEMLSPEIRFEPFTLYFAGPSNCGKSHLAQQVSREMLKSIAYKSYEELVYVRTPGNAYWNGLRNQPVCLFDDFLCISDTNHSLVQIGELFCLKSKAVFNPPMAAIEEKKIRYNPLIVMMCANKAFPHQDGLMLSSGEAWRRRRDVLIEVIKDPKFANIHPRSMTKKQKEEYAHLKFRFYKDPSGGIDGKNTAVDPTVYNYAELNAELIKRFHVYFNEECLQYAAAIKKAREFYPDPMTDSDSYLSAVKASIRRINDARVDPDDVKELKYFFSQLEDNKYLAELTTMVNKRIIEIKKDDAKQQIVDRRLFRKKEELNRELQTAENPMHAFSLKRAFRKEEIKVKAQVHNEIEVVENAGEEEIDLHSMNNLNVGEVNFDLAEFKEQFKNPKYDCNCNLYLYYATRYAPACEDRPATALAVFPVKNFYGENCDVEFKMQHCGVGNCVWDHLDAVDYFFKKNSNLKMIPEYNYPKNLLGYRESVRVRRPDEIPLVAVDDVIEEVTSQSMWQKFWSKIPSFGTIFKALLKVSALFAGIGLLLGLASHLMYLPTQYAGAKTKYENDLRAEELRKVSLDLQNEKQLSLAKNFVTEEGGVRYSDAARVQAAPKVASKVVNQSAESEATVQDRVRRNTFWIYAEYIEDGIQRIKKFRCVGLVARKFLILDHYVYCMRELVNPSFYFVRQSTYVAISSTFLQEAKAVEFSALMVSTLPATIPFFPNIIKFFVRSKDSGNLAPAAQLHEHCYDVDKNTFVMKVHEFVRIDRKTRLDVKNDFGPSSCVSHLYAYPKSGRGLCGSILTTKMQTPHPIIGIHIAGMRDESEGYSEAIVYETFESLQNVLTVNEAVAEMGPPEDAIMMLPGNVELIGSIPKVVYPPKESRIVPSDCVGLICEPTYDKPVLNSKDVRIEESPYSPLLEGCKHHTQPPLEFNSTFVDLAAQDLSERLIAVAPPQRLDVGVLSIEQAICGIPMQPEYTALPFDTSEGWPWIEQRPQGAVNKSWMFDLDRDEFGYVLKGMNRELREALLFKDLARKRGEIQPTVFTDCLKDAKLPREKVLIPGKTRIFSISPVDFTIHTRQYMLDFVVALRKARFRSEVAIGMDVNGIEADKLANYLLENSPHIITADYSKFGDTLMASCVEKVFVIINNWYKHYGDANEDNSRVRSILGYEVMYAMHLMLNLVYKCYCGMPSGNPITVEINSMVNSMYVRCAWLHVTLNKSLVHFGLDKFHENVRMVTYGDDKIMSVKEDVIDFFNAETISQYFGAHGIKYTNASKTSTIIPYSTIYHEQTSFLKCTFGRHPYRNLWVMKLDKRAIEETSNWVWNKIKDTQASSITACLSMLENAHAHGPEYYNFLRDKVVVFWAAKGVVIVAPPWSVVDTRIYIT